MDLTEQIEEDVRSLFSDEYQGDYRQAYNHILEHQSRLATETEIFKDPEQIAHFLQSKIRVFMLIGRLNDAYAALEEFKALIDEHIPANTLASYWGLRYAVCKFLVDYYRRYPPCIRYQHESQAPTNTCLIENILGPKVITAELIANVQKYCSDVSEELSTQNRADLSICFLFQRLIYFPQQLRLLTTRHPLYPGGTWKAVDADTPEEAIASVAPYLQQIVQPTLIEEETNTVTLYFHRLYIELYHAMESPSLQMMIQKLFDAYNRLADQAGMANCRLFEADSLLSPPFTSPVNQNLIPIPTNDATGDGKLWDIVEAKVPFKGSERANKCYEEALELFRASNSPRGQAAVLLRQASIMHARACELDLANTKRRSLLEAASEKYTESLALFDLDEANAQVVKANQILLDVSKGYPNITELKTRAAEIGKWGRENRNELISYHIGLLMLRFARREWRKYSRFDIAYTTFECAHECCKELGVDVPAFIGILARAGMQHDMSNVAGASVLADQCLALFDSVMEKLGRQIDAIDSDDPIGKLEQQHMLTRKHEFITSFNSEVSRILVKRDAIDSINSYQIWQEKYHWYADNDQCFAFLRRDNDQETGKFAKEYFGRSLEDILDEAELEKAIADDFHTAEKQFKKSLYDGNLECAETSMREFVEASQKYRRFYGQYMFQMIAYDRLGDTQKVREILNSVTDSDLFNNRLDDFLEGKNIELFFPTLANNAIYTCMIAQDWERGSRVRDLIYKISPTFFDEAPDLSVRQVASSAIFLNNKQPEMAFKFLLMARRFTELRRSQASDLDVKIGALSTAMVTSTFLLLADICLQCAELDLPINILDAYDHGHPQVTWEEHALLFMEESRARSLVDSLLSSAKQQSNDEEKRRMSESIYKRRALTQLHSIRKRTARQDQELEELAQEVGRLDIGTWSSTATDFMDTIASKVLPHHLFGHLNDDVVVIETSFFQLGCILMAVTNNGIESYHREPIREVDMRKWAMEMMQIMREMDGLRGPEEEDRKARVEKISRDISNVLLSPFSEIIRQKRHIIFSSSEPLSAFPFSALIFQEKPLFLHAAVSQTPSLTALYHLSKRRSTFSVPTVSVFTKAISTEQEGHQGSERASIEDLLPMAGVEAISISRLFSTWPIEASTLSRAQFRDHIQGQTSILHIGTHGTVNSGSPLLSSISIGEDFRVIDMSPIQSNANLIVFAACLSGLGRATAGTDVLGFTHVVLGTGCQAYIGTLFEVNDFASMVLMTLFYQNIKNEPYLSLAEALRRAQMDFWQFNEVKAATFLDGLLETWDVDPGISGPQSTKRPEDIVPDGRYWLVLQKMMLHQIDWTSPIFWAPFTLMGHGDFCFSHSQS